MAGGSGGGIFTVNERLKAEGRRQNAEWRIGVRFALLLSTLCILHFALCIPVFAQAPAPPPTPSEAPSATATDDFNRAVFFGKKFFDLHEYASAYEQYAKADALQPDQPGVLYNMAVVLAKGGRYSESQTKVDRYLQLYPNGAERALIGKLQLELEFQRELQKKRQSDQDYAELFTRGKYLYAKNDLEGALKLFQDAEQQRPNDPSPVFNEGVIYEKLGDLAKADERLHHYEDLEHDGDQKTAAEQRILALESEIDDMKTKFVCSFCGLRLPIGAIWCPRCWHGPYLTSSAVWNTRPCVDGSSAVRATYYSDDRFAKNDTLPCLWNGTMLDALRYTPAKQRAIQEARKSEGWTYSGEVIQGLGKELRYVQGADYLEKILSQSGGEVLNYNAHRAGDGIWILDREEFLIEGQKYAARYSVDAANHITEEQVDYQNASGCNDLITVTADYAYTNDALTSLKVHGGYDGTVVEGTPRVDWEAVAAFSYDTDGRVAREELVLTKLQKIYKTKPQGAARDEVNKIYPSMRVNRPVENIVRTGDVCATNGTLLAGNPIDLRPLYVMSPDLAIVLPFGVTKATVSYTYPESFKAH